MQIKNQPPVPPELFEFIKAIASESRMNILLLFLDGEERTVNQIAEAIDLSQPATSEQLGLMKRAGVLMSEKQGKEVYYRPDRAGIVHSLETLTSLLKSCCDL